MALYRMKSKYRKRGGVLSYYGTADNLKSAVNSLAATSVGDYALFGGGSDNNSSVTAYSSLLTKVIPTSLRLGTSNLAATSVGDYALFGGGSGVNGAYVTAYNTSLTRSNPTNLSQERRLLAATSIGNYALFGGGTANNDSSVVDVYQVA